MALVIGLLSFACQGQIKRPEPIPVPEAVLNEASSELAVLSKSGDWSQLHAVCLQRQTTSRQLRGQLESIQFTGAPLDAEALRQRLAALLYSPSAPLRLRQHRLSLRPADARLCGEAALRAGKPATALNWFADAQQRSSQLSLAWSWLELGAHQRTQQILSQIPVETLTGSEDEVYRYLEQQLASRPGASSSVR